MRARIFQPAKTAMQSGMARTRQWVLEFEQSERRRLDPLMGWTGSSDVQSLVRMPFDSREAAIGFAEAEGIDYVVIEPKRRRHIIRQRGYGENFATDRKGAWTH